MNAHLRSTLKLAAIMLAAYTLATGTLILVNHQLTPWQPDLAWPIFWIIWLFAYWPIALAAFACIVIIRPPQKLTVIIHITYIAITLIVMQIALTYNTSWPLVILKITGLIFAFTCITALPRNAAN